MSPDDDDDDDDDDENSDVVGNQYLADMWKLDVDHGRQRWLYVQEQAGELNRTLEEHLLTKRSNFPDCRYENPNPEFSTPQEAVRAAVKFYSTIQTEDGHWAGDYGGPMFLMPGLVITLYSTGVDIGEEYYREMIRYLTNQQQKDGGWGLHVEGHSTIFGTAMNYVAMRIMGVEKDDERMIRARNFLHEHGGACGIPSWGKFWLSHLGVYHWDGMNPVPPELWYLPSWVPFHPSKMWCHCRVVYLPMAYIYGSRSTCKETDLVKSLREELYPVPYESINWPKQRNNCHPLDRYFEASIVIKTANAVLSVYEKYHNKTVRKNALDCCIDHIVHEDETTKYIDIGPVNKTMNMLCCFYAYGEEDPRFTQHIDRIYDYLWLSDDGMKMQGYNGSQLWDTAFAVQAIVSSGLAEEVRECMIKAHEYLDMTQVDEDVDQKEKYYRHISKGAWPFSTKDHGWPISDCTAEGLKASLALAHCGFIESPIPGPRLFDAVNVLLSFQNPNGGWATYELQRAGGWMEKLNPSEVFGGIMVDYQYVECTSASVQALMAFQADYPEHKSKEIEDSIQAGLKFIQKIQRADGSWYGSWGVCFTYGTWFGVSALSKAGHQYENSVSVRKACDFLAGKQMRSGGWGETYECCVLKEWCQNEWAQIIHTSWALLALMAADYPDREVIDRGIQLLMRRQMPNGDFPQECITGVFNNNCMITYTNYRNIFPIWALGTYSRKYPASKL